VPFSIRQPLRWGNDQRTSQTAVMEFAALAAAAVMVGAGLGFKVGRWSCLVLATATALLGIDQGDADSGPVWALWLLCIGMPLLVGLTA
jgi:hypothetical protein